MNYILLYEIFNKSISKLIYGEYLIYFKQKNAINLSSFRKSEKKGINNEEKAELSLKL